jgi:hypothetical protein
MKVLTSGRSCKNKNIHKETFRPNHSHVSDLTGSESKHLFSYANVLFSKYWKRIEGSLKWRTEYLIVYIEYNRAPINPPFPINLSSDL